MSEQNRGAIFTLDLGTKTGWAIQANGAISSGTVDFKPGRFEGGGMAFVKFAGWLNEIKKNVNPNIVHFEEVRHHVGVDAAHKYGGFMSHLTAFCETNSIPYQGVPVGTIKKHATGKGNASKAEVITAMIAKGHMPKDDNEADALAILYWALGQND